MVNRRILSNPAYLWLLGACLLAGLLVGTLVPWSMAQLAQAQANQTILIVTANGILLIMPWLLALIRGRFDLFEPIFMFSLICFFSFVIAPLTLLSGQDSFLKFIDAESVINPEALTRVTGISFLGLVAFYVGYYSLLGRAVARSLPILPGVWRWKRLIGVILVYTLIGYALFGLLIWQIGGIGVLVSGLHNRVVLFAGKNYLAAGATLVSMIALLWFSAVLGRKRISFTLIIYIVGALILTLLLGSKTNLLGLIFIYLILYHYLYKPISIKYFILFSLLAVTAAVAYDLYFREYIVLGKLTSISLSEGSLWDIFWQLWDRFAYNTFIQAQTLLIIIESTPELIPYQNGRTILAILSVWIPRAFYPDKPLPMAGVLTEAFRPALFATGYTLPPSVIGELYLNFAVGGVVVGMALFGMGWRIVYDYMRFHRHNRAVVLVYAISLSIFLPWFRGDLMASTVLYLLMLLPIVIAFFLIAGKTRSRLTKV